MTSAAELRRAVEPVKHYFHGEKLTANAVLAAWLRHEGVPASGEDWLVAKAALDAGQGFAEAAKTAAALGERKRGRAASAPLVQQARPAPRRAIIEPPKAPRTVNGLPVMEQLAKLRTAGDMNAEGARRLLGAYSLDPVGVLVRETAQNSWDARLRRHDSGVELVYHLFRATPEQTRLLRRHVFSGTLGLDQLGSSLADRPWLLEISDRGTKGLGGPTRNDQPVEEGDSTDYMDLVLNLGAPRDVAKGGGTYGFGKTITYTMSSAETVLIWTRTGESHEQRLIGAAMGSYFDHEGRAYTGRHWWGLPYPDEDRVEPLRGAQAEALAGPLFRRGFAADETGTSILIVAPDFGDRSPEEYVMALQRSVERELWPKLVAHPSIHPMAIHIRMNDAECPLTPPAEHPVLRYYAKCLTLIRNTDLGTKARTPLGTKSFEIRGGQKKTLIGHLVLAYIPETIDPPPSDEEPPLRRVCLMRNEAELVVKYHRTPGTIDGGDPAWVAVFKPLGDVVIDNEFAMAEPPTHDDWVPPKQSGHSRVRMALNKMKRELDATLKPTPDSSSGDHRETAPVGPLANALAGLAPVGNQTDPAHSGGGGRSSGLPRVASLGMDFADAPSGRVAWDLLVEVRGGQGQPLKVVAVPNIVSDGGAPRDVDFSLARVVGWFATEHDRCLFPGESAVVPPGSRHRVRIEAREDLAVSVKFKVSS